jgi:hypothetical protein
MRLSARRSRDGNVIEPEDLRLPNGAATSCQPATLPASKLSVVERGDDSAGSPRNALEQVRGSNASASHERSFVRGCASTASYRRWPTAELAFIVQGHDRYQSLIDFGCGEAHSLPATRVKGESQRD